MGPIKRLSEDHEEPQGGSVAPGRIVWSMLCSRLRRFTPLLPTHWFMEVFALLTIVVVPAA